MQTIQKIITLQKCERCGYTWVKRVSGNPVKCPKCSHRIGVKMRNSKTKKLKVREAAPLKSNSLPNPNRPKEDS
jgi:DNA-directed RNA polymerase subunit RPC12/RpoP